jgi:hypothetical protein
MQDWSEWVSLMNADDEEEGKVLYLGPNRPGNLLEMVSFLRTADRHLGDAVQAQGIQSKDTE